MRILFTGGGTLGPVTPLLAVAQELIDQKKSTPTQMHWVGTANGPERDIVKAHHIRFSAIKSGKLRRYFSLKNFSDPFLLIIGIVQALKIIRHFKPDVIFGAGGYTQVPVIWAAWLLKKKSVILQLDFEPGLANLMCASLVDLVLISFAEQTKDFPRGKTILTGLPIRKKIAGSKKCSVAQKKALNLDPTVPTVFISGGGTGSQALNELIISGASDLVNHYNIIHLTGKGKQIPVFASVLGTYASRYQQFEFLSADLSDYVCASDVVITRGGIVSTSEFSSIQKPMIIIPIPDGHQEKNALFFEKAGAALWRNQNDYSKERLLRDLQHLLLPAQYAAMQHSQANMTLSGSAGRVIIALESIL